MIAPNLCYSEWLRRSWNVGVNSRGGVTKALFINFPFKEMFNIETIPISLFESFPYLIGITAAELWRHLSDMNMIFSHVEQCFDNAKNLENNGMEEICLVTPTLALQAGQPDYGLFLWPI